MFLNAEFETKIAMERLMAGKKTYHEMQTDSFEIDEAGKAFLMPKSDMSIFLNGFPWQKVDKGELSLGDKSTIIPRIRLISSATGNRCTFFMTDETKTEYVFMPSIGSLMNKKTGLPHLRGWKIIVKK